MCDESKDDDSRTSGGSLHHRKLNFDDVTVQHECVLPARPNVVKRNGNQIKSRLVNLLVTWSRHPSTGKNFLSSEAVHREVMRQTFSSFWYIIHPCSSFRFYWDAIMSIVFCSLFLLIPFAYAFHQDLGTEMWCITVSEILNTLCILDIFFNFFTGYKAKYGNFVVLHHGSIIQNYLRGAFTFDLLSTLPFDAIYRLYFKHTVGDEFEIGISIAAFHFTYLMKFLRFASWSRMLMCMGDVMISIKLEYVKTVIAMLVLKTVLFIQLCLCVYKAVASSIFFYFYRKEQRSVDINMLLNPNIQVYKKYVSLLDDIVWAFFGTSIANDMEKFIPGKVIITFCMLAGLAYNTYIITQILNIMNTIHAPRSKYYEIMNQLDAYMQKKQFPMHLQERLKFFYGKKFRKAYYKENEIMEILSEPLQREIIINAGRLFVDHVKLFKNIPKSIISKIAWSCIKEQFLPNDLIIRAGSIGDCMFFIASGTVCVTTTNGIELCHLEDGDCFGEIEYVLKNCKRLANVRAVEFCEVYILDYASFKKYVPNNESIMQKITETADELRQATARAEEEQKRRLQEKIARESFND